MSQNQPTQTLARNPVGAVRWPPRAGQAVEFTEISSAVQEDVRTSIHVQGEVTAILPLRSGQLIGWDAGEFGGGLVHLTEQGSARTLIDDNIAFAWLMGGKLYLAAGLGHLGIDRGHVYVVDTDLLRVERNIRLPASPSELSVSSQRIAIVETAAGDTGIGEDGTLIDPHSLNDCREG